MLGIFLQFLAQTGETALEGLIDGTKSWTDALGEALAAVHPPTEARTLLGRYREAFPVDYREVYTATPALAATRFSRAAADSSPAGRCCSTICCCRR